MALHPFRPVLCLFFLSLLSGLCAAQEVKKPAVMRLGRERVGESDGALPKYSELELPPADELMKVKPFDWIVLKNQDVLVVEPVGPRPETLVQLNSDYERYIKGRAGMVEGDERLREKRMRFLKLQISLWDPGPDQEAEYLIETRMINRIEYFEDFLLRRANELIDAGRIPLAYDFLMYVDRRNRENNVRLAEAYESQRLEEAAARAEEERFRFSVAEPLPLRTFKSWPKFDDTYHRLLFHDAMNRTKRGEYEPALIVLENLWDHNSAYPELPEKLGQVVGHLVQDSVNRTDYRQARHFLTRLANRDPQNSVALKWKSDLLARAARLINDARAANSRGDAPQATRLIELAARVWPDAPGLRDAHREFVDRFQSLRLGVLRLPGEPTTYPLETDSDVNTHALTKQVLFEPVRVDERGVRYRSSLLESWEPADLGRQIQFTLRLKRADWEARPLMTSADIFNELTRRIDSSLPSYDERLAEIIERITVQSPSQFSIHFRHLPLRLEALMEITIALCEQSLALNPDLPAEAMRFAGRQRFYEHGRVDQEASFRRVHSQPSTAKSRYVDEIVQVKYETWERALQAMLRGEIVGIPHADLKDLKRLQNDNRFFVIPYALPASHFLLFNPDSVPLRDGQLRKALSLALPRQELLNRTILAEADESCARLTAAPFSSSSYGHNRMLANPVYDPQRAATMALTAKKLMGGKLPDLRLACPPDPVIRATATEMIEHWRRVGITVQLIDDANDSQEQGWDFVYCTAKLIEPLTEIWPLLTLKADASVESLRPLPERVRRQLLELERTSDWPSAIKRLHRIETELLLETRYVPLWEVDEYFVTRRHLIGLPNALMHAYHDVERWKLQSWYPQETP